MQTDKKTTLSVPFALRKEMEDQVQNMLRKGVIEESTSPWLSPVILVPKKSKDGKPKYRFCVDFRALNAVTFRFLSPTRDRGNSFQSAREEVLYCH